MKLWRRAGYTFIELVAVMSLISLATALSYPSFRTCLQGQELGAAAQEMLMCLRLAHWKAVASGRRTRLVTFTPGGANRLCYTLEREEEGEWISLGDFHRLPEGVHLRVAGPSIKVFNPNGTCSIGSLTLLGPGAGTYRLALNPATGRVRLYRGDREVGRAK